MSEASQPRLFNVIVAFDVYCVAIDAEPATAVVLDMIRSGEVTTTHVNAIPVVVGAVHAGWRDERPIVADDVPDAVFEQLRGKTTQQAFDFFTKR